MIPFKIILTLVMAILFFQFLQLGMTKGDYWYDKMSVLSGIALLLIFPTVTWAIWEYL